jgi:hypothetical protein
MKRNPFYHYQEAVEPPPPPWNAVIAVNYDAINEFDDIECKVDMAKELIYAILKMAVKEDNKLAFDILDSTKRSFIENRNRH